MRRALITGCAGQDGVYLTELLLAKGYVVHGMVHRESLMSREHLHLHVGDFVDAGSIDKIVAEVKPDEIYNLGAQSNVRLSFDVPEYTYEVNAHGTLRLLDA